MRITMTQRPSPRRALVKKVLLALATVTVLGAANLTPAKAWYDAYGYWHPNYHRWHSAYWHHRIWCEHHPYACGYRAYAYDYDRGYR